MNSNTKDVYTSTPFIIWSLLAGSMACMPSSKSEEKNKIGAWLNRMTDKPSK